MSYDAIFFTSPLSLFVVPSGFQIKFHKETFRLSFFLYPKISIQKGDKRATQFFSVGLETTTVPTVRAAPELSNVFFSSFAILVSLVRAD